MRRKALKDFSSTVWGNVSAGEWFDVAEGYCADLESWGMIAPVAVKPAPRIAEAAGNSAADDPAEAFTAALTGQKRGPGRPPKNR